MLPGTPPLVRPPPPIAVPTDRQSPARHKAAQLSTDSSFSNFSRGSYGDHVSPFSPTISPTRPHDGLFLPVARPPMSMSDPSRLDPELGLVGRTSPSSEVVVERRVGQIAIIMIFVNPMVSFVFALWGLVVLMISPVLALFPGRSPPNSSFGIAYRQSLVRLLAPSLAFRLRLVMGEPAPHSDHMNAKRALMVLFLSPFTSVGASLAAIVTVVFWGFTMIIGDPANVGKDGSNDGKLSVLAVRQWWVRWLMTSVF